MAGTVADSVAAEVAFCSSLKDDVWHNLSGPNAFESWHFDGISDDGREAVVVSFYDNYVLSPRFIVNSAVPENVIRSGSHRFPAVSFVYAKDGKPVLSSVNEFVEGDFVSTSSGCGIGNSSFRLEKADYGSGFVVSIDILTRRGRRIKAEFEWLIIESDLSPAQEGRFDATWNAVAPRADVSGRIQLIGRTGRRRKSIVFRGTGYHDLITSANVHYRDLSSRMWGRAHFVDSTVIFDRLGGAQDRTAPGRFYLIRDAEILRQDAACEASDHRRDIFGLSIPRLITFDAEDGRTLTVRPVSSIRSIFTEVKMLSEMTLSTPGGKTRSSIGITEFVDPRRLRFGLFRWLSDLKIGRDDRAPYF